MVDGEPAGDEAQAGGARDFQPRGVTNFWSFASVVVVIAALVAITVLVVREYDSASDAGAILGIVIPVLATVGAAIFGVTVAYQAGSRSGATQTRNEIANTIEREVGEATDATEPVLATIESAAASPAGKDVYVLGAPESAPVAIPQASLAEVRQRLNRLRGIARGLRAP